MLFCVSVCSRALSDAAIKTEHPRLSKTHLRVSIKRKSSPNRRMEKAFISEAADTVSESDLLVSQTIFVALSEEEGNVP